MKLFNVQHLQSFAAQGAEVVGECGGHIDCQFFKELTGAVSNTVGFFGLDWQRGRHVVHPSIPHLFDLHQEGYYVAYLSTKIVLKHVVGLSVKDVGQRAQVPLFCILIKSLLRH